MFQPSVSWYGGKSVLTLSRYRIYYRLLIRFKDRLPDKGLVNVCQPFAQAVHDEAIARVSEAGHWVETFKADEYPRSDTLATTLHQ